MSTDLELQQRKEGLPLTARAINQGLMQISEESGIRTELEDCGKLIRFRIGLKSDAPDFARIQVDLAKNGSKLVGSTRGHGAALLYWCFHALARRLGCDLRDPQLDVAPAPNPRGFLDDAKRLVRDYEAAVLRRAQDGDGDEDDVPGSNHLAEFLAWLVELEMLSLACPNTAELARQIELDDDSLDLYESLLESPAVDEIFASEEEFAALLKQYRETPVRGTRPSAA